MSEQGWTLVELMLTSALVALITPMLAYFFLKATQGMAADEMRGQLIHGNEAMMARVENRLATNKHFYPGPTTVISGGTTTVSPEGVSFVADLQFASGTPSTVAGTQLPQEQTSAALDPSSPGFQTSYVGNSMFFASYDFPQTFSKGSAMTVVPAPLTISGAGGSPVTDSSASAMTIIIDLYRFYYYYLTPSTHPLPSSEGVTAYGLVEWQSRQYPDLGEIQAISDSSEQNLAVSFCLAKGMTYALNASSESVTSAFYSMTMNTPINTSQASFTAVTSGIIINQAGVTNSTVTFTAPATYLCQVPTGIVSRYFFYGISPNTAGWQHAPAAAPVPIYGTAAGQFPGGFEVVMGGSPQGRQIQIRSCWVAKGAAPNIEYNNLTSLQQILDDW